MAQKLKQTHFGASSTGSMNPSYLTDENTQNESPGDFMNRCGAKFMVEAAVRAVLQARPKDPIAFLGDFFGRLLEPKDNLLTAYEKIQMNHYSNSIFEGNLVEAYDLFKSNTTERGCTNGLTGECHNELLIMLTKEVPVKYSGPLLKKLMKSEKQSISFSLFRNDVTTVLLFEDFINTLLSIYQDIDFSGTGSANQELCFVFLKELKAMLDRQLYGIDIDKKLTGVLSRFSNHEPYDKSSMKLDDFVDSGVKLFFRTT